MEKITSHMKLAELKQSNLCKAHEQLHSEASSFLLFSLQWKDLERHFDSTQEMIQTQYEALEGREKAIALKEKELDDVEKSIDECSKALELKKDELSKLNTLIKCCDGEVGLKEKELDLAEERLGVLTKDIKLKEDEVNLVCMRILDLEKEIEHKEKAFDMIRKRIDDCEQVIESKEQQLNGIMQLIKELSMECELKQKSVESVRTLLQEQEEELVTKEKQYDAIQMAIKESNGELKLKEKELESIQNMIATKWKEKRLDKIEKSIRLRTEELDLKEKEFVLMQNTLKDLSADLLLKESELDSVKTCIKEHSKELDMQERQLDSTQQSIRDCQNEVILLTRYVSSLEKAIIESSKEWELENHLDSLQGSVDDYSNELPSMDEQHNSIFLIVDKCLEGLKAQKEHFNLLRKSIEERSEKLKNDENVFERRTEELDKKDEKVRMYLKEIESVKVDMDSQMKLLEKGREELRLKEIQHKVQAEKLESKEKDISLIRAFMEKCSDNAKLTHSPKPNILHPKVKTEQLDCRPTNSSNTLNFHSGVTGKLLLVLLCEHLKLHDLVRTELVVTLQTCSDPAKLVLDAMRCFYPVQMESDVAKIDLHNIKRGCVLLSELLLKFSPQITPPLKEEALKLAGQWKVKMAAAVENHVEVVAFLLLVANFGLASNFNADELQTLLNSVSQYKQALELGRALGIAEESSVGRTTALVKLEQRESSPANSAPVSSLKNEQLSMDPNERRLHLLLNEQLTGLKLMPSAIFSALKESSDPPKLVLDVIQVSFYQQLKKEQIGFEESFSRWCILLLKQLMQISPKIDPKLKGDAMKLAVVWKLNIGSDTNNNSLETVGFLQLLVSFGLTTSFSQDEILKLFENIVLHEQASDLCARFGFTQKIYELVQNLIGTKQFVKAVRFICGYKLECFRPVQILNEYMRDARNATLKASKKKNTGQEDVRAAMDEAIDKEIDAVKSVITCVADCNLSSEISSLGLEKLIVTLEDMRKLKCNSQVQPPCPTTVEMKQPHHINVQSQRSYKADFEAQCPHPINVQSQQPHKADFKVQCPHPIKGEVQQPHLMKAEVQQQPHPTHHARQQRPTHQPQQQYPPNITAPQELRKKRKDYQFQNGQNKYRRKSPPSRPMFSNSSPSVHDEKANFQRYNSRFAGMHGLFGLHEGGHGSTEHGNHYTRPPWSRS